MFNLKDNYLETGDILLKKGTGISQVISWYTNSDYTHAAIVYEKNIVVHSHIFGVVYSDIYTQEPYDVYTLKKGLSKREKEMLKRILAKQIEKDIKYDYEQFFGYVYYALFKGDNKFNSPKKFICTELVDRAYKLMGYNLCPNHKLGDLIPPELSWSKLLIKKECV